MYLRKKFYPFVLCDEWHLLQVDGTCSISLTWLFVTLFSWFYNKSLLQYPGQSQA